MEGRVKVGHDVAEEGDGDDGEEAHGQLGAVRLALHQQDAQKGEVAQGLQERPPARVERHSEGVVVVGSGGEG